MLEVVQYIFGDFWRFLQCAILLMIIAMWHPINITINAGRAGRDDREG